MKKYAVLIFTFFCHHAFAQESDSVMLQKLFSEIMLHSNAYEKLHTLTKDIGHRLSGSPEAAKAVQWGKVALEEAKADSVWLQPVTVPVWLRGEEWLKIKFPGKNNFENVAMLSLGNTDGTGGKILEKQIICVDNLEEFDKLSIEQVTGKIVFFNYKFHQDWVNTFKGYGDAVIYRTKAVNEASKKNAAAVIIRSVSTGADDIPHTGASHYEDNVMHIPAVAIGNISAERLAAACKEGKVKAQLLSNCRMNGTAASYNVIGELKGSEHPEEYIVVGGHLDSWDVGEGAHDDGAGCVQSIEVIRTYKALGLRPKHTIRVVLFMNEENGARGAAAYADSVAAKNEKHIFAIESDAGGFSPRGIGLEMPDAMKLQIRSWVPLFLPYGVYDFSQEESGVDISFLGKSNIPLAGLLPDPQRYFDIHHNASDIFEAVNHRELKLGAWTMAALIYLVDKNF